MRIAEIKRLYAARPFHPFTIRMADGRHVWVRHPDYFAISPNDRSVFAYESDGGFEIIDVALVTSLEVGDPGPRD